MADGRVAMEDMVELDSLINCIRTYMSDFCVKLTTSMRTLGKVMEKVSLSVLYTPSIQVRILLQAELC